MSWDVEAMRKQLQDKTKYKYSEKWFNKVAKMSESQVIAIYLRMKSAGQISA